MRRLRILLLPLVAVVAVPASGAGQIPWGDLVVPGSFEEESLRTAALSGDPDVRFPLLRSTSNLTDVRARGEAGPWAILGPEIRVVWNSDLPHSFNDGILWAGRGTNVLARGGVRFERGPLLVHLVPEIAHSANEPFQIFPGADPERSGFSSPWHEGRHSLDLPLRFGSEALTTYGFGQSVVELRGERFGGGIATENVSWGPAVRNPVLLGPHAEGFPHLFLRSRRPLAVPGGSVTFHWLLGALTESIYFDGDEDNDLRSLSGLAVTFSPSVLAELEIGAARIVMAPADDAGDALSGAADVLTEWEGLPGSPGGEGEAGVDQLLSFFARWAHPASGFEVYADWARQEVPGSLSELLAVPQHTQGYTLGLQWVGDLPLRGDPELKILLEATDLEQARALGDRPFPPDFYSGRAAPQGFTHRGQVLGAGIGPGGSSHHLAVDYRREEWWAGIFLGRIRWETNAFLREPLPDFLSHDVSLFGGVRGAATVGPVGVEVEITGQNRLNYLFQNGIFETGEFRVVDVANWTLAIGLTPRP